MLRGHSAQAREGVAAEVKPRRGGAGGAGLAWVTSSPLTPRPPPPHRNGD